MESSWRMLPVLMGWAGTHFVHAAKLVVPFGVFTYVLDWKGTNTHRKYYGRLDTGYLRPDWLEGPYPGVGSFPFGHRVLPDDLWPPPWP